MRAANSLAAAFILLFSVSASVAQEHDHSRDILWQTRSPKFITALCIKHDLQPRCHAIAWWGREPCIVMLPPPPAETAPEIVIRSWLGDLNHERRHCRERRNFHKEKAP